MEGRAENTASGGPIRRAVGTSVHGNAPAFGFSIMITCSFGAVSTLRVPATLPDILLFGIGAALSLALLEGLASRGFRERLDEDPQHVQLLGTAMNFLSVAAGVGIAIATAGLVPGGSAWPLAGFLAALAYAATESAEIMLAERVQARRGRARLELGDR
jgi:hypothetical protein